MHQIMDAERDATMAYLDRVTRQMGGRRGEAAGATPTGGLIYAHTRHATSRAGDPCPHDHVLLANLVEMLDEQGGWKAADTALWREHLHAATMVGRVAAARVAVELGYGIEADPGPSGRLGHWRIAGVPDEVMEVHSKRAAEIEAECRRRGDTSYQARGVAARTTRKAKRHEAEGQLVERWRAELASIGWPVERLAAAIDAAAGAGPAGADLLLGRPPSDCPTSWDRTASWPGARCSPAAMSSWPWPPTCTARTPPAGALADRALADPEAVPLVGVAGARERAHSLASVLARETAIAESLARQIDRGDAPAVAARCSGRGHQRGGARAGRRAHPASSVQRQRRSARRGGVPSWSWGWPGRARQPCSGWWPPPSNAPATRWWARPRPARRPATWAPRPTSASRARWPA